MEERRGGFVDQEALNCYLYFKKLKSSPSLHSNPVPARSSQKRGYARSRALDRHHFENTPIEMGSRVSQASRAWRIVCSSNPTAAAARASQDGATKDRRPRASSSAYRASASVGFPQSAKVTARCAMTQGWRPDIAKASSPARKTGQRLVLSDLCERSGGRDGIRTHDLLIANEEVEGSFSPDASQGSIRIG